MRLVVKEARSTRIEANVGQMDAESRRKIARRTWSEFNVDTKKTTTRTSPLLAIANPLGISVEFLVNVH